MLQIYKQNRALLQALCASHLGGGVDLMGGGGSTVNKPSVNVDKQLTKVEQQVLREYLKAKKEISATATIETASLYDLINQDVRKKVEDLIGTGGIKDIQSKFGLTSDGVYGPGTFKSVVAYQRTNGLVVDGIVGPATYEHITGKKLAKTSSKNETGSQATEVAFTEFTRPLFKGTKGEDVKQLQTLLGIPADGDFGPATDKALRAAQGAGADGIAGSGTLSKLTGKKVTVRKMTAAERGSSASTTSGRRETIASSVRASAGLGENIKVTAASVDKLTKFIEQTSGKNVDSIYNAITKGKNFEREGYSILKLVRMAFGANEASVARNRAAEINNIVDSNKSKFTRAYQSLLGNQYKETERGSTGNRLNQRGLDLRNHAIKALPWIAGVYLFDIPLPFMRKMVPSGVPMDKAFAFTTWVQEGMIGEFNPKEKVDTGTQALSNLKGLRNILSTATRYAEANANKGNLVQVSAKVKTLIQTYIVHRFGPDANLIRESSQNAFENLFDVFGAGKSKKLINKVINDSANGQVDFNDVFEVGKVLWAEDNDSMFASLNGKNAGFIQSFDARNAYMASASRQGDVIDQYIGAIVAGKGAFEGLQAKEQEHAPIPDTNAKYRKGAVKRGSYGPVLGRDWDGDQVLQALQSTRPTQKHNRDSVGWIMRGIRNLEVDMDARKIPYDVITSAISDGAMVPISSVGKVAVNTSISGKVVSTDVATLMGRGDTHLFHAPIEYTVDGQKLKYNLYIRPDCSNFVMVPEQWDNNVGVGANANFPVVIPWNFVFPKSTPTAKTPDPTPNVTTKPGVTTTTTNATGGTVTSTATTTTQGLSANTGAF